MACNHERRKKLLSHGRKAPYKIVCKDCGVIISKSSIIREEQRRRRRI